MTDLHLKIQEPPRSAGVRNSHPDQHLFPVRWRMVQFDAECSVNIVTPCLQCLLCIDSHLLTYSLIAYHIWRYKNRPQGMSGPGLYDPTNIMNADTLSKAM